MNEEPEVLVERRGRLGLLTLNRPRAINALTHHMVEIISGALEAWRDDDEIQTVAVVGAGERGLCAGGDVISLYRDATQGDGLSAAAFWADEYRMNSAISAYPKPFVAIQDGIVLGGGIGVSAHGSHRIVTERSKLGFPETTIGYFPDVGATWLLSRAPGHLGRKLALTAESIGAADAILVGFSDSFVPSEHIAALLEALEEDTVDAAIARFASEPPPGKLQAQRTWIDAAFAAETVDGVLEALRAITGDHAADAASAADTIEAKSPIALAVAQESLRRAASLESLEDALRMEYRMSRHASKTHDFVEGIRAQLVDKDRNPRWQPATSAEVTVEDIEAYFEVPPEGDLEFKPHTQHTSHTSKETS